MGVLSPIPQQVCIFIKNYMLIPLYRFFLFRMLSPSLARNARRRGCFFCRHTLPSTTTPSLARNARRRGGVYSVGTPSLAQIPSTTTNPSLARNARRRRCFFCRHTLPSTTTPSLARNTRQRGCLLTTTTPPLLKLRAEGFPSHQPPPPLPRSKRKTEGSLCFVCR
jgi:hypothetical protein